VWELKLSSKNNGGKIRKKENGEQGGEVCGLKIN
jgi:hypothetical protein